MHIISFPNLGIENLQINRVAFSLFGRNIYWYGVIIMCAIALAVCYVMWRAKQERIKTDDIYDLSIWAVIAGIVGARAYYVLTSLEKYDSLLDAVKIWEGGLGFYGCVIGGALAVLVVCRVKKLSFAVIADMVAPSLLLAQAIGRWGNFFNAEAYGSVTEWDFFGKVFDISESVNSPFVMYIGSLPVQPTFLYECIWNLIGFTLLTVFYKKKKFNGQVLLSYLAWYGFGRMLIEGFRTDSLYIGSVRISQLVGAVSVVAGIALTVIFLRLAKQGRLAKPFTFPEELSEEKVSSAAPSEESDEHANEINTEQTEEEAENGEAD